MQRIPKENAIDLINRSIEDATPLPKSGREAYAFHPWEEWIQTLRTRAREVFAADSDQFKQIASLLTEIEGYRNEVAGRLPLLGRLLAILRAYAKEIQEFWTDDANHRHDDSVPTDIEPATQREVGVAQQAADKPRNSIVVLAALYEELEKVFDDERSTARFPLQLSWSRHTLDGLKTRYWRTVLDEQHELIAVTPDSMGLTETAIVATAAFKTFKPSLAAMIGICAGRHDKGVRLGHIVVPTHAFHYQFGARTENELKPEIRAESVDSSFSTAAQSISGHESFPIWMNEKHPKAIRPKARCECHVGPMASSDYVAKWDELIKHAANMDRKVIGIDMESYAFLRAAKQCGLARESFIVKCVTDYADKDKDDQIREWAQVAAARFFYSMLQRCLDDNAGTAF